MNNSSVVEEFPPQQSRATQALVPRRRAMMTLPECAFEAGVSRRFLEKEIARGRLVARKLSTRICRVLRSDWERYLDHSATSQP
jgi:hypothetical protein